MMIYGFFDCGLRIADFGLIKPDRKESGCEFFDFGLRIADCGLKRFE